MLRSIATVGGNNLASRILGFVRDILIARILGTGPVADAFFVALRFPNLFRSLFAEGAFNSAFVPMFVRRMQEAGPAGAKLFAENVLGVMVVVLLALTLAAEFGMPWLMPVIAPGFSDDAGQLALAILFTRITFPYLLFMSLTALQGGVLNALQKFGAPAAAPILLNVVMIAALLFVATPTSAGYAMAWAVAVAGACQFLWLVLSCWRAGMALRLPLPRLSPHVRRLLKLMVPGVIGAGVMQINLVIGTMIATLQAGAVSYLYYADRVYQFPLALIGTAAGVVLLPELSRSLRRGEPEKALATLNRSIEFSMLLTIPAAAALIAIPEPIVSVLFERGAFGPEARAATALAVIAYAVGLPAYVLVKAFAPAFFAREDTATPFRFAVVAMLANIAFAFGLFQVIGFVGIALATALSSALNAAMLGWRLHRRGHLAPDARLLQRLPRILLCSVLMAGALWVAADFMAPLFETHGLVKAAALTALVSGGIVLFLALAWATGAFRTSEMREALRRG